MRVKDYYKTLELVTTASQQDIKKAFRQLAMKYHPDKNSGNQYAEAHFKEIQEAYHVLSNPERRAAYNEKRWYRQLHRKRSPSEPITPLDILKKCRKLRHYITTHGRSHIDRKTLNQYILHLLRENSITLLLEWNDVSTNQLIIDEVLKASELLPYPKIQRISERLLRLAGTDNEVVQKIHVHLKERRYSGYWQRFQGLVILVIALTICWLIYMISN